MALSRGWGKGVNGGDRGAEVSFPFSSGWGVGGTSRAAVDDDGRAEAIWWRHGGRGDRWEGGSGSLGWPASFSLFSTAGGVGVAGC